MLNRRRLILFTASALAASPAKAGILAMLGKSTVSPGFTVAGNSTGTAYTYAPLVLSTVLHRTVLVAQDEDYIDLQAEVAHPGSPVVTTWSIGGADNLFFYSPAVGQIAFKASSRAFITPGTTLSLSVVATNAYGASSVAPLSVVVPLNSDCRFVSSGSGSDANNGTTPALAWQHTPRSYSFTGTQVTLGAHQVLFYKAENHRTFLAQTNVSLGAPLQHTGVSGDPFIYCGRGWSGQATLDGSDIVSGWAAVNSGEVFNNPNAASIQKIAQTTTATGTMTGTTFLTFNSNPGTLGLYQAISGPSGPLTIVSISTQWNGTSAIVTVNKAQTFSAATLTLTAAYFQHLYDDGTMCFPAQWPTPSNLFEFDNPIVNQTGGMWSVPAAFGSDPGGATQLWQLGASADVHIRDPRIAVRYGNLAVADMPQSWQLWAPGNNITICPVLSYDFATSTIVVTSLPGNIDIFSGKSAYAAVGHPLDIVQAGQYSDFGGNRYAWLPNGGVTSISTRGRGVNLGNYVQFEGLAGQRYCGALASGVFEQNSSTGITQPFITGCKIFQNRSNDGAAMGLNISGTGGVLDGILERCFVDQNLVGRFFSCARFNTTLSAPTPAQVRAYPYGKLRWNYIAQYGAGRTLFAFNANPCTGIHILMNIAKDVKTVHGNGISIYNDSATVVNETYFVIELNLFDNISRPVTTSISAATANFPRFHTYTGNVFLAYGGTASDSVTGGPAFNLFAGEPGSILTRNIAMMGTGSVYTGPGLIIYKGYGITVKNNVASGIVGTTPFIAVNGGALMYDIESNLLMVNTPSSNLPPVNTPPNQIQSGNTVSVIEPTHVWDYVISAEMATALGAGAVGPFWNV